MNWALIISQMEERGASLTSLAREIGVSLSTLSDLKHRRTKEPKWTMGSRLVQLHGRLTASDSAGRAAQAGPSVSDKTERGSISRLCDGDAMSGLLEKSA